MHCLVNNAKESTIHLINHKNDYTKEIAPSIRLLCEFSVTLSCVLTSLPQCTTEGDGVGSNAGSPKYMNVPQMSDAIGTPPQVQIPPYLPRTA